MSKGLPIMLHCALVRQAVQAGTALSSLYRMVFTAVHTVTPRPVRYVGVFTDGGTANMLREHGVDSMCAPLLSCFPVHQADLPDIAPFHIYYGRGYSLDCILQVLTQLVGELQQRHRGQHQRCWPSLGVPLCFAGV